MLNVDVHCSKCGYDWIVKRDLHENWNCAQCKERLPIDYIKRKAAIFNNGQKAFQVRKENEKK